MPVLTCGGKKHCLEHILGDERYQRLALGTERLYHIREDTFPHLNLRFVVMI